jgi:hypothetical protein
MSRIRTVETLTTGTNTNATSSNLWSTEMYTMYEALAREHLRQLHSEARQRTLAKQLASAKRWRSRELRAHAAYERHARRADLAAQAALAD